MLSLMESGGVGLSVLTVTNALVDALLATLAR